jgi:poly-beta-1,6-N-acetyl-D-glucosamine synthase
MFLLQVAVGMALDRRYEPEIGRYLPSVIAYPVLFWLVILLTVIVGHPRERSCAREAARALG